MIRISDYIDPKLVKFLDAETREEAIRDLIKTLKKESIIEEEAPLMDAIIEREKIVTTGIGMGVAIPHAKLQEFDDFFLAIGILPYGVEWEALDGNPVRLVFLIGGPDDKQTEYLQILSSLTQILKNEERRKKLFLAKTPEEVVGILKE